MKEDGERRYGDGDGEPDVSHFAIGTHVSPDEFLAVTRVYARRVVDAHGLNVNVSDLDWEVSKRAKRRAGAVKYSEGNPEAVSLTWEYFQERGWAATAETIRHELIHVHLLNERGDGSHGSEFRQLADELKTTVRCEIFAEPKWWIVCQECGAQIPRYRRSKVVKHPAQYRCGRCDGEVEIVPNQTDA